MICRDRAHYLGVVDFEPRHGDDAGRERALGVDLETARLLHEYALNVALDDPQRAASVHLSSLYTHTQPNAQNQPRVSPAG